MKAAQSGRPASSPFATELIADLSAAARRHLAGQPPQDQWGRGLAQLTSARVDLDENVCRDIADRYDSAPPLDASDAVVRRYAVVKKDGAEIKVGSSQNDAAWLQDQFITVCP